MTSNAMYVGRVGALAVALGVGMAVATSPGVAWATGDGGTDSTGATSSAGSTGSTASGASADADSPTGTATAPPPSTIAGSTASTPSAQGSTPSSGADTEPPSGTTATTTVVAAGVVVSSSGGAHTSTDTTPLPEATATATTSTAPTPPLSGTSSAPVPPRKQFSSVTPSIDAKPTVAPDLSSQIDTFAANTNTTLATAKVDPTDPDAPGINTNQMDTQPTTRFSTFAAVAPAAVAPAVVPAPVNPVAAFLAVPAILVDTATKLVEATLAYLVTPTPGTPPESPLIWTVLAIVRRQLFNETPTIIPAASKPDALGNITISLSETDADGDRLVYSATDGNKGTVTLNADGHSFTYTPNAGQTGTDTLTITASDDTNAHIHGLPGLINALSFGLLGDSGHTAATTVTVKLNTPPTLSASPGAPNQTDGKVTVTLVTIDPDSDPLTLSVTQPAAATGTVSTPTLVDAATGTYTVTYTPSDQARHTASADTATDTDKSDTFTVSVSDGHGATLTRTVEVTIAPDNEAPAFSAVTTTTDVFTGKVTGTVVFTDGDNDSLIYSGSGQTAKGKVVVDAAGTFTYTPDKTEQFIATATEGDDTDTFSMTVNDGHGATATVTVTVTVTPAAIASDGAAALAGAESVIGSALGARATAQRDMATLLTSLGATVTGADLTVLMAKIEADIAASLSTDTQTAADGKAAIRTKLGPDVTDTDIDAIAAKVAAIRAAEASLTTPIAVAATARAVAIATTAATGAPVFSRVKDLVVSPTGAVTGTVVYIDPEGDPLLYNVLGVDGNPAPGSIAMNPLTGAFLYAPNPLFGDSPTSVTFGVFVNDRVHLVSQNITIGVTPTAEPATLAEAETALAANVADLEAAIKDKIDALTTDPTAIAATTAQIEAVMAAVLAAKDKLNQIAQNTRA